MKKLLLLLLSVIFLCSCESGHPKQYLSFSGKLDNFSQDSLLYITGFGIRKRIKVNEDGSFQDSLKVIQPDLYTLSAPKSGRAYIYLENGYDLKLSGDAKKFFASFRYEGNSVGAESNNFVIDQFNFGQSGGRAKGFLILEKDEFQKKIKYFRNGMDSITKIYDNADPAIVKKLKDQNNKFFNDLEDNYDVAHNMMVEQAKLLANLEPGKQAPEFNNYENFKGGTNSLKDFRGNFVYIDVWATWCSPCIAQIPFIKQLEKDFKGKNLSIVSISTDDERRSGGSWQTAHDKWSKMVKEKDLSGIQLWAGKDDVNFSKNYQINTIPRFILIDPEGKIINSNAMRPTNPKIKDYLYSIGVK